MSSDAIGKALKAMKALVMGPSVSVTSCDPVEPITLEPIVPVGYAPMAPVPAPVPVTPLIHPYRSNVAVGWQALKSATTGQNNTAIGYSALKLRVCPECSVKYHDLHPSSGCNHGIVERIMET